MHNWCTCRYRKSVIKVDIHVEIRSCKRRFWSSMVRIYRDKQPSWRVLMKTDIQPLKAVTGLDRESAHPLQLNPFSAEHVNTYMMAIYRCRTPSPEYPSCNTSVGPGFEAAQQLRFLVLSCNGWADSIFNPVTAFFLFIQAFCIFLVLLVKQLLIVKHPWKHLSSSEKLDRFFRGLLRKQLPIAWKKKHQTNTFKALGINNGVRNKWKFPEINLLYTSSEINLKWGLELPCQVFRRGSSWMQLTMVAMDGHLFSHFRFPIWVWWILKYFGTFWNSHNGQWSMDNDLKLKNQKWKTQV